VRIPTFSRQSEPDTVEAERPTTPGTATTTDTAPSGTAPVRPRRDTEPVTPTDLRTAPKAPDRPLPPSPPMTRRPDADDTVITEPTPVVTGPRPRASLLATLGLILSVAGVLLVLSGPLLGYGIGVAGLGLILSLSGIHATGKRHVAGKTDALIGMVLSLGAIVLGVLALTGSLTWLGTDMQPVNSLREWLDTQFVNRF
jgi:hypothetical protein